ncbi:MULTISPECIES: methyl-accepting chemotaxis protein [unclassified Clostridium]|uniref:methyl-accepting chemotaxis protein n=1 Tax=unclassified Clostridium TaxID=2614128 RepID=UPI00029792C2|nr:MULTISPECIES: methyl-accepting chemotaxis protein [unclassified Clostridium]EKQ55078.1 MAG: methyl-accepting chemotaxis protein [Clostridium sp. Maddingley MBC34-26]
MNWFLNLKIGKKLILSFVLISLITGIMGIYAIMNLKSLDNEETVLYEHMTVPISQISEISTEFQRTRVLAREIVTAQSAADIETDIKEVQEKRANVDKLAEEFNKTILSENMRQQFETFKVARSNYREKYDRMVSLVKENKGEEALAMIRDDGELGKASKAEEDAIEKMVQTKVSDAKERADLNTKNADITMITVVVVIIFVMSISILIGIYISRLITKPIKRVLYIIEEMCEGHFAEKTNIHTDDEIGQMSKALDFFADELKSKIIEVMNNISKGDVSMDISLKDERDELAPALKKMVENIRSLVMDVNMLSMAAIEGNFDARADLSKHEGEFKRVIEGVNGTLDTIVDKVVWYEAIIDAIPFPIHVTDNNMNWTYMNKSFENLLTNQGVIKDRKSGYGLACSHAGANICNTEKCGIKQLQKGKAESFFEWCGMSNKQDTSYLKNKNGENVGYVEVVTDLTPIIRVSDYTKIEVKRLEENLKLLSNGNTNFDLKIQEADKYTEEVSEQFKGIYDSLEDVKNAVDNLIADAGMLSKAAIEGKLNTRADSEKHSGDFKRIVEGVNATLDSVITPLNVAAEYVDRISKGDIPEKITDTYYGDFNEIKNNLNNCIDNINALITDANVLSNAAMEGNLDTRADEAKHSGDFKKIVVGINELIEAMVAPIKDVIEGMTKLEEGNLQVSISENYKGEFGVLASSVNSTINSLNNVISEINNASEQVLSGSRQVSDASQGLSQGATQQASAIEELNASIADVANQTKENADNANQAKELALKVKENAEEGNKHMEEMLKSMSNINESSANISKIIKVIDEIAFQTNILALNAAVEAARAGQHGKGFAVVAEEVRNLAERSANAAQETTDLIEGSIKKIEKGTEITNKTAKALDEMVESVSKAAELVAEIAALSNEQASSISQINLGIDQVSQVVQENSSTAEQSAAASEELSSQAELLKEMVSNFKLKSNTMINGPLNSKYTDKLNYNEGASIPIKEITKTINRKLVLSDREFGKY